MGMDGCNGSLCRRSLLQHPFLQFRRKELRVENTEPIATNTPAYLALHVAIPQSSMVMWTATEDPVIYHWKTKAIYCTCCLCAVNTALKYYDIHYTSICILTLPWHICGINGHYFSFLCCVPPEDSRKRPKYVGGVLRFYIKVKHSRYRPRLTQRVPGSWGSQISWQRLRMVLRLSAIRTGRLYPQEMLLVLICVRGWIDPRAIVGSNQRPSDL
jgi:hypothetical protein